MVMALQCIGLQSVSASCFHVYKLLIQCSRTHGTHARNSMLAAAAVTVTPRGLLHDLRVVTVREITQIQRQEVNNNNNNNNNYY